MARLTDIDTLLEEVVKIQASGGDAEKRVGEIILAITNAPTMEIVRCNDCKYSYYNKYCTNEQWKDGGATVTIEADDSCSYGERKDDA